MVRKKNGFSKISILQSPSQLIFGTACITFFFSTKVFDPFNTPKLAALLIVASLSTLIRPNSNKNDQKKYKLIFRSLLIAFLSSGLLSVIFSESKIVALFGDTQRRNGYLCYVALSILGYVASRVINFTNISNLFTIIIFTSIIFSFYGLIQILGKDFISWNNPYNAVIATVGNPNFASALMAIFASISFASLFIGNQSNLLKSAAILSVLMSLIAILASNSRQGLVSFIFASLFFVSLYVYSQRKKIGQIIIIISFIVSMLAISGMLQFGPLTGLLYKPSVSVRGYYWDAALQMLTKFPFTGVGFDHYGYYFKEMRSVEYPLRYGFDLTSTNAHNTFLQMFATGGLFLGISYLLIVLISLFVGLKIYRNSKSREKVLILGLLSGWIAFQAQSLISIDNIGISVWGWLLTGSIFGLAREQKISIANLESNQPKIKKQFSSISLYYLKIILLVIPSITIAILLMRLESNTFMAKSFADNYSVQPDKNSNFSRALLIQLDQRAKNILNSPVADPNYKLQIAYDLFNSGDRTRAVAITKDIIRKFPRNQYALEALSLFYENLNKKNEAIKIRMILAQFDPWNAKNYLSLMRLNEDIGDSLNAKLARNKIISIAPNSSEAKIASEKYLG